MVVAFESVDAIFNCDQLMKAIKQYFPVVLIIMLYKVVLTFEPMDEILKFDYSSESYWVVIYCGAVLLFSHVRTLSSFELNTILKKTVESYLFCKA